MQVRLHLKPNNLDLINCYQHVAGTIDFRSAFWDRLHDALQDIPKRNFLYLIGDFNTTLAAGSLAVGLPNFLDDELCRRTGPMHRDWQRLDTILKHFGLTALNTWNPKDGPTFRSDHGCSRIDFICTRQVHADTLAKDVKHILDHPLLPLSGSRHSPLLVTLPFKWYRCTHTSNQQWTFQKRQAMYQSWKHSDSVWTSVQHAANSCFHTFSLQPPSSLEHFHTTFNETLQPHAQPHSSSNFTTDQSITPFHSFWNHTDFLRRHHECTLYNLFHIWKHTQHRAKDRKAMRQYAKHKRKQKRAQVLQTARRAANAKDQFELYQHIRSLAPKMPHKRVQLRASNGSMLTPAESADAIRDWLHELYQEASPQTDDASTPTFDDLWHFTECDLRRALQQLKAPKALAPAYAPAVFWRTFAAEAAQTLFPVIMQMLHDSPSHLPTEWGAGFLSFIPKPGRACHSPSDLRPIALLEPVGKALLGLLSRLMMAEAEPKLLATTVCIHEAAQQ